MLCLGSIDMDHVISEQQCVKGTILQNIYNAFVKYNGKKNGSHDMTVLHPNLCYNEMCYKGTHWLSGRALDLRSKGHWFETRRRHFVVSLSKTLYPLLSTGLIQKDRKSS